MNNSLRRFLLSFPIRNGAAAMVAVIVCCAVTRLASAGDSVEEFLQKRADWPQLIGQRLTVEGRYSSIGGNQLRFEHCELTFTSENDFPKLRSESRVVEATGRLEKKVDRLVFAVERLRQLPSDSVRFLTERDALPRDDPQRWEQLADWARNRAAFYDYKGLELNAQSAYDRALSIPHDKLSAGDDAGRMQLAARAAELKLNENIVQNYRHEALRTRWAAELKQPGPNFEGVRAEILKWLPGSEQPLQETPKRLQTDYTREPDATYGKATADERTLLHRLFYLEVVDARFEQAAKLPGLDGFAVAAEWERLAVERKPEAEQLRERQLTRDLQRVGTMTRAELGQLAVRLEERNRTEVRIKASQVWLTARAKRLGPKDAEGRLQLADEYVAMVNDTDAAQKLLLEAYKISPTSERIVERLQKLGLTLQNGAWIGAGEPGTTPQDAKELAVRQGRVERGMSPSQLQAALGQPTAVARVASAADVTEIWIYGDPGTSQLAVFLVRNRTAAAGQVVAVEQVSPER